MAGHVPLPGSKRALLPNSRLAGPYNPSEISSLTIRVRSTGNKRALEDRVREQGKLPLKDRTYLTREELAQQHGASEQDLDLVERYAQQHDLVVVHRSAAERSIVLKGKLSDLLAAFPANVQMYHHATGTYRGRQGEIQIPQVLAGIVTGVFGYDTRRKRRAPRRWVSAAGGPGGQNGVAATEFAKRYNFPTQFNGKALDGTGQTIAIIELGGGYRTSDLKVFFNEIKVPLPSVTAMSVDHAGNSPTSADSDDGEVMLDLEVAGAVAPKAKLAVYFAPNDGDKGFLDAISAAVHDSARKPSVISISWGEPDDLLDEQSLDAYHELFVQAAAVGVTVCAASGDHGVADEAAQSWDGKIHVNHPPSDDMVLGCGGTQIDAGKDVAWNDGTPLDASVQGGGGWVTGGGISQRFAVPDYQTRAELPVSIDTSKPGRGVPDIAMSATNYFTRVDSFEGASGGTSAVAPLMAGLIALLNQATQKNVGFMNPFLYATARQGTCLDVTEGNNGINNTVAGYNAGPGWDACTGLGTPDGNAILSALTGNPTTGLRPSA
jgi:kumamolisin